MDGIALASLISLDITLSR